MISDEYRETLRKALRGEVPEPYPVEPGARVLRALRDLRQHPPAPVLAEPVEVSKPRTRSSVEQIDPLLIDQIVRAAAEHVPPRIAPASAEPVPASAEVEQARARAEAAAAASARAKPAPSRAKPAPSHPDDRDVEYANKEIKRYDRAERDALAHLEYLHKALKQAREQDGDVLYYEAAVAQQERHITDIRSDRAEVEANKP